jgi:hypothetical protein
MSKKQTISAQQYADKLGISKQAVCKKIRLGKLPKGVKAEKIGVSYVITITSKK